MVGRALHSPKSMNLILYWQQLAKIIVFGGCSQQFNLLK